MSEGSPASRELPMHLAIYRRYRGVGAIVHTHSPWATAWSHEHRDLDLPTEELEYHQIRRIRCSPHAPAGSAALGECAANALADAPAPKHDCKGKNDCKGHNGCKGQGFTVEPSAKACSDKGGTVVKS